MSEKNSGFMNGNELYNNARKASWDGDTMDIEIKDSGDAMSISLDKEDLVDLLGRSCHKTPLDKRLGNFLTSRKNTHRRNTCSRNTHRRNTHRRNPHRRNTHRRNTRSRNTRSRNTRRQKSSHTRLSNLLTRPSISSRGSSCKRRRHPSAVSPVTCYV